MKERLDIYLNGRDGLRTLFPDFLLSWRQVPRHASAAWRTAIELVWDLLPLLVALLGPFLAVLTPLIAIFTAHRIVTEEEMCARLRRGIHQNGPGS